MSVMDWEIMQTLALEVPDEILSYAQALQDVYESGKATFQAGKELYQQVNMLDTELFLLNLSSSKSLPLILPPTS